MPVTACWAATLWSVAVGQELVRDPDAEDDDEQRPEVQAAEPVEAGVELPPRLACGRLAHGRHVNPLTDIRMDTHSSGG